MFSKPEAGWVDINIGNYEISASYLTDIPMDFLNSLINNLENNLPFSVFIDEEGIENILCAYYDGIFIIIKNGNNVEYKKIDMDFNTFRADIVKDIEIYLNDWIDWNMEDDPQILKSREIELRNKLSIAKEKLKKHITISSL